MSGMTAADARRQRQSAVARWYEEHGDAGFPGRFRGEELAGVDLVLLDADIAGCVVTWQAGGGRLGGAGRAMVRERLRDLDRVLPLLTDEQARHYFRRLRELARLIADG